MGKACTKYVNSYFLILETTLQITVEDLENPAAGVIPMSVLRQFTDQLSGKL